MAWLSQNWILVLAGVALLAFILLRRTGASGSHRHDDGTVSADGQGPGQQEHRAKHPHGGHGCC